MNATCRQPAKLEHLGLVTRPPTHADMRVREAAITRAGKGSVASITLARRKLLGELLEDWSAEERRIFPQLVQRLADSMRGRLGNAEGRGRRTRPA